MKREQLGVANNIAEDIQRYTRSLVEMGRGK
jgi:hypothetical protein